MAKSMEQIFNATVGFYYNEQDYVFEDVDVVSLTYNRKNHLTRGANGKNKTGYVYQEGTKTPDTADATLVDCTPEIYALLNTIYKNRERIDFYIINDTTGRKIAFDDAIISDAPKQNTVSEGEDGLSFHLIVESFNTYEE